MSFFTEDPKEFAEKLPEGLKEQFELLLTQHLAELEQLRGRQKRLEEERDRIVAQRRELDELLPKMHVMQDTLASLERLVADPVARRKKEETRLVETVPPGLLPQTTAVQPCVGNRNDGTYASEVGDE